MATSFIYGFDDLSEAGLPDEFLNEPVLFDLNYFHQTYIRDNKNLDYSQADIFIREGFLSYVKTGMVLHWMRKHLSVKFLQQYCRNKLKISHGYANQIIKAARVTWELIIAGFDKFPLCVAQALPLSKYLPEDSKFGFHPEQKGEFIDKWSEVLDLAERTNNQKITAKLVSLVCNGEQEKPEKLSAEIEADNYQKLVKEALGRGISVKDLLNEILNERYTQDDVIEDISNDADLNDSNDNVNEVNEQTEEIETRVVKKPLFSFLPTIKTLDKLLDDYWVVECLKAKNKSCNNNESG